MKQPRGIRNNNPGNLRWGDPWQGLAPRNKRTDKSFCQFINAAYGIRALARTLITYQDKYGLNTARGIISRWAPESENDTAAYVRSVANAVGVGADDPLDVQDYSVLVPLVEAIIRHENGKGPLDTPNTWYDEATIRKAMVLAGVEPHQPVVAKRIPVTKETLGASATGTVGVAQLADVAPQVVDAVQQQNDKLSSGSIVQIVFGVLLIGLAIFIAYGQVKRHQAGTL